MLKFTLKNQEIGELKLVTNNINEMKELLESYNKIFVHAEFALEVKPSVYESWKHAKVEVVGRDTDEETIRRYTPGTEIEGLRRDEEQRLPNSYDNNGNPNIHESYNRFMCPDCHQGMVLECKENYIVYNYIDNNLYSISTSIAEIVLTDSISESIPSDLSLREIKEQGYTKSLIDNYNNVIKLIERWKDDTSFVPPNAICKVNVVKDNDVYYTCTECGNLHSITDYIDFYLNKNYSVCPVCGEELEQTISKDGEQTVCSHCGFNF